MSDRWKPSLEVPMKTLEADNLCLQSNILHLPEPSSIFHAGCDNLPPRPPPTLCVSLGIRSAHQKTWHRNNSQRLFHFTFTLFKCLPALAHIEVSPLATSVAQRWHKCGRRWGWGGTHYSRPACGWVTIQHASCHANVHSCGLTHFPLIWQRSWAPPARPSCQPPIRLHFRSILIVHGLRSKSSSFTDKEAVSTRKVKLWWK